MPLNIQVESKTEGVYYITLDGRLDTETYMLAEKKLMPLASGLAKVMIFDLAKLSYISSMGLRVILKVRKAMDARKGCLVTSNVQPQIQKVFEIANALPAQSIFASVEEADRYLDRMQNLALEKQRNPSKPL